MNQSRRPIIYPSVTRRTQRYSYVALVCLCVFLGLFMSACAPGSGIFGGGSWQASGLSHQHIRTLAVNSENTNTLYAGSEQGQVFLSTDAGAHWVEHSNGLPASNSIHALLFDGAIKQVLVATDKGIFANTTTLQQWRALSSSTLPGDTYTALDFAANAPTHLYVGTLHHGVLTSADGGSFWSALNNGLPAGAAINGVTFDGGKQQVWAATSAGVYLLAHGEQTWRAYNAGLAQGVVPYEVQPAVGSGSAQNLVYLGTNHGFYRSLDGGANWSANKENFTGTSIRQLLVDFRSNNGSTLYVSTDDGIFRSDNRGDSWIGITTGLPHAQPVYALVFGSANYAQLYAGSTDGVYQYPGNSNGLSSPRVLLFLVVLV
ncbi:MAG TPA: hypothetical protein VHZ51_03930, partial [Ktedonobacteraceae bacterium]|nr:hypothetical protein [Ktedonobacteraceae bacterium]